MESVIASWKKCVRLIESILVFNISVWYGHLILTNKNKQAKIIRKTGKMVDHQQQSLHDLYRTAVHRKALSIIGDTKHSLHTECELLPSGRRYRAPLANKKQKDLQGIPSAINY